MSRCMIRWLANQVSSIEVSERPAKTSQTDDRFPDTAVNPNCRMTRSQREVIKKQSLG